MSLLSQQDPAVARAIEMEDARQRDCVVLIASENYASKAVLEAQTSVMNNKYARGLPRPPLLRRLRARRRRRVPGH